MTVFDAQGPAPDRGLARLPMVVVAVIVVFLLVMFISWELATEITFTSTVTTPILPDQVIDSATSPVTTAGR